MGPKFIKGKSFGSMNQTTYHVSWQALAPERRSGAVAVRHRGGALGVHRAATRYRPQDTRPQIVRRVASQDARTQVEFVAKTEVHKQDKT